MFQEIDEKFVRECTDALEFYDENGVLPWEKKRVNLTLSYEFLNKTKGKNRSKFIEESILFS